MLDIPTTDPTQTPQLLDITCVSEGWLNKYLLTYRLPNGTEYHYESVSRKGPEAYAAALKANADGDMASRCPDAVCIVPILPNEDVLLIREFRYAVNGWVIAFPAGLIEEGENLRTCIDRELLEETGYRVRTDLGNRAITILPQSGYTSVGMSEESIQIAIASVEQAEDAKPEPSEFIQTFTLAREDIGTFLDTNHDLIGARAQLLLELMRRTHVLKKRIALALNPITKNDYA